MKRNRVQRKHAMERVQPLNLRILKHVPNILTTGRQVVGVAVVVTLLGMLQIGGLVPKVVEMVRKIEPSHAVQPLELKRERIHVFAVMEPS